MDEASGDLAGKGPLVAGSTLGLGGAAVEPPIKRLLAAPGHLGDGNAIVLPSRQAGAGTASIYSEGEAP